MKKMKCRFWNSFRLFLSIPAFAVVVSCAGSAPPVPDDTTSLNKQRSISISDFSSIDAAMDCQAIQAEASSNAAKINQDNEAIKSNRRQNEVAGYMAGIFVVPIVATESNDEEKADISALQQRQDVLTKLTAFKNCQR